MEMSPSSGQGQARKPGVSAIVPVYNGAASIAASVKSILASDRPPDSMEVICADNASTEVETGIARWRIGLHWRLFNWGKRTGRCAGRRMVRLEIVNLDVLQLGNFAPRNKCLDVDSSKSGTLSPPPRERAQSVAARRRWVEM